MTTGTISYIFKQAQDFRRGRHGANILSLILHSTDGREEGDIETLTGDHGVSVHWYVTRAGKIYHFVQDADAAFHVGTAISPNFSNDASIGIEQEHFDPSHNRPGGEDWPDQQIEAVAKLAAALQQKHGPLQIRGHKDVAVDAHGHLGRKEDPANYPFPKFNELVTRFSATSWTLVQVAE